MYRIYSLNAQKFGWWHIKDHFVLEWKSTLKIVESTLERVDSTIILYLIKLHNENLIPNITQKRSNFQSFELRE